MARISRGRWRGESGDDFGVRMVRGKAKDEGDFRACNSERGHWAGRQVGA